MLYYGLLKPGETINGERYQTQLILLKRVIAEKRPEYATRHEAIIFHHDNAGPHVAIPVKNYSKTPFIATPVYRNSRLFQLVSPVYRNKLYHFFSLLLVEGVVT